MVQAPFQQWDLDFIGKFKDNSSNGYTWILTATDYFTKWVEAIPTKAAIEKVVMDFLEDKIITRFVVPTKIEEIQRLNVKLFFYTLYQTLEKLGFMIKNLLL